MRDVMLLVVLLAGCAPRTPPRARSAHPPCTFGADQTCNDDPTISSLWGRCTEQLTCECKAGLEINPETGRCRRKT